MELGEKDISQKDLGEQTGLTTSSISELANNKLKMYPKGALENIMVAFLDDLLQRITT
ncbi:helix-turn-helix domain-containing protein [Lysinibacillus fusiformis]|uniref:helix-turn-helix domain-containing protein n=1 Tax=Lysinibacillus fusiformis TaxID=28031 RepID=UPI00384CD899